MARESVPLVTEDATAPNRSETDAREAWWLGIVLRTGVAVSGALVAIGLGLFLVGGHGGPASLDDALGRNGEVQAISPMAIVDGLRAGSSSAFILAGLLVLILTPTARVFVTFVIFLKQRELILAALAGFVLILLVLGLIGVGA